MVLGLVVLVIALGITLYKVRKAKKISHEEQAVRIFNRLFDCNVEIFRIYFGFKRRKKLYGRKALRMKKEF